MPELSNNFFNLEPGHIPLPNMPPPPSLMVPPMFGPPPMPPFFFTPPQATAFAQSAGPLANPSSNNTDTSIKPTVHYPSQDPSRLGATQLLADRQE